MFECLGCGASTPNSCTCKKAQSDAMTTRARIEHHFVEAGRLRCQASSALYSDITASLREAANNEVLKGRALLADLSASPAPQQEDEKNDDLGKQSASRRSGEAGSIDIAERQVLARVVADCRERAADHEANDRPQYSYALDDFADALESRGMSALRPVSVHELSTDAATPSVAHSAPEYSSLSSIIANLEDALSVCQDGTTRQFLDQALTKVRALSPKGR